MTKSEARINRIFDKIEKKAPFARKIVAWIRKPEARVYRIPIAVLLILGGVFSILPGLGFWMLPLGLLFLAIDVYHLRSPIAFLILKGQRKWTTWRRENFK